MNSTALLVVDVQNLLIQDQPYNSKKVISNIKALISAAHSSQTEVIYVRHDDGPGSSLEANTYHWQIYDEIAPAITEKVFDKRFNSAFRQTGLKDYLISKNIDTIILVGLQTEYCIDATCKAAFEFEFKIIIPEETNSTFDNDYLTGQKLYEFYNYHIWKNRFAAVVPMEEALQLLS